MKVNIAFLQTATGIPGVFSEQTLSPEKVPGLKLSWEPVGLCMEITKNGKTHFAITPHANVKLAILDEHWTKKAK